MNWPATSTPRGSTRTHSPSSATTSRGSTTPVSAWTSSTPAPERAGATGPLWARDGLPHVSTTAGLETWDPVTGTRTGLVEGFRPTAHNPATGVLAELDGASLRTFHPASGVVSRAVAHYGA
ncbi:hypothetical protein JOF53_003949 [Crossiella equi]|uniref:Uncharacterized protein n=1 Tax=Crossiella equi TaxID=130796 RepID=A0ABS5AFH1_9PSEU|nr:hypothetical protein [Crossiella equi]MBP2475077.1 hypothetical protein [Crossiella equi]